MSNTIQSQLNHIKQTKPIGLMTHVVIGYPSLDATVELVKTMADAGVDFIELQIPFSDPVADGPTIMAASDKSLANGTTVKDCVEVVKKCSKAVKIPLFFMGYYNTLFSYGLESFLKDAKNAGAQGLIIPDMPLDEEDHEHYMQLCEKYGLTHVRLLAPASTEDRIKQNATVASGFIYLVGRYGTTGAKGTLDQQVTDYITKIKKHTDVPIAVGFGISTPEHVRSLHGHADIAIIGSAIINLVKDNPQDYLAKVSTFIKMLQQ